MGRDRHWQRRGRLFQTFHPWGSANWGIRFFLANHAGYHGEQMKPVPGGNQERGFTLIEMLAALGIFLLITGAAFTLLSSSQQRYQTESQVLSSFQEARLGLDQMVRDINDAGFPPPAFLASGNGGNLSNYLAITPFAWSAGAGYFANPCQIQTGGGGTCTTSTAGDFAPGDFDVIIETNPNPNPQDPSSQ